MEYNTERNQLLMPEYGRNIQQLVEHCKSLTDRQARNEMAMAIVEFIGQRNHTLETKKITIINFGIIYIFWQIMIWM
jgi:hypothetical protein